MQLFAYATQIQTTMRYAHLADDPVREVANEVGALFGAANGVKAGVAAYGQCRTNPGPLPRANRARSAPLT